MKVLYIGVYRDGTGWGQAATDYILALDAVGVDVVPRALKLNESRPKLPQRLLELEAKSAAGCTHCIQHVLPHQMDYNGRMFNIGLYASETSHFKGSSWTDRLNQMDSVWAINWQMVQAAHDSGYNRPITVVPHTTDIARFERSHQPLEQLKFLKDEGQFVFYTIGEFTRRKNLAALLKAFHLEFDPSEPVQLVIKTSRSGMPQDELRKHLEAFCSEIKRGLKLHGAETHAYKKEIVLLDRLTDDGMLRLHAACDCFVQPSYGEAWSIPAFDAMAMGKTPIVTAATGYLDYLSEKEGWLVDSHPEPVFGVDDSFNDLFVGTETWASVDVGHLRRCMREAYAEDDIRQDKAVNGVQRAYDFDYETVGMTMRKALENEQGRQA